MIDLNALNARLQAAEADLVASRSNEQMIVAGLQSLSDRVAALTGDHSALLDPGSLTMPVGLRSTTGGPVPDIGQAGLERLRQDSGLSGIGRSEPFSGTGNLLNDPTLETNSTDLFGLAEAPATYSSLGPNYAVRWETTSGTAPVLVDVGVTPKSRIASTAAIPSNSSSSTVSFDVAWGIGAAGVATFYMRSRVNAQYTPSGYPESPFLVASTRLAAPAPDLGSFAEVDEALAWVEILDSSLNVLATGDTVDLLSVSHDLSFPVIHASLLGADYSGATSFLWRLVVQVTASSQAKQPFIEWIVAEPSLNLSEDDAPQSFQPAIGAWTPYWLRSINVMNRWLMSGVIYPVISGSVDDYSPTGWQGCTTMAIDGGASSRNITGFAAPDDFREITFKFIYNIGANPIVLKHGTTSSASNQISGVADADVTIRKHGCALLGYFSDGGGSTPRWRVMTVV